MVEPIQMLRIAARHGALLREEGSRWIPSHYSEAFFAEFSWSSTGRRRAGPGRLAGRRLDGRRCARHAAVVFRAGGPPAAISRRRYPPLSTVFLSAVDCLGRALIFERVGGGISAGEHLSAAFAHRAGHRDRAAQQQRSRPGLCRGPRVGLIRHGDDGCDFEFSLLSNRRLEQQQKHRAQMATSPASSTAARPGDSSKRPITTISHGMGVYRPSFIMPSSTRVGNFIPA